MAEKLYNRIILGIDPGTRIMGYGIIGCTGKNYQLISLGVVHLEKLDDHAVRLKTIFDRTSALIEGFQPDEMAIEAPFYGKNVQSMLKLGRAQGVAIAAALQKSIPVSEYSPRKIKQSITGNGNASKEQVAALLEQMMTFESLGKNLDATDGLAVALCHFFQAEPSGIASITHKKLAKSKAGAWTKFLTDNPERLK
jgi:crossover junction endodeoxyribonuclease RuvC